MPDGGQFHVFISSESTKLNVNYILQNGRDDLLENLFIRWGVLPESGRRRGRGIEKISLHVREHTTSPSQPAAQPAATNPQAVGFTAQFSSVAEMSVVPEFGPVMKKQPDWMNFFTTWGDGKIDINLADADTIALVTGVSPATANQVVKYRLGPDGKPFTTDDRVYNSLDEVRAALGMSPEQFQLVQDFLSLNSAVDRIESTGIIAGHQKQIIVVTSRNTIPITYLAWQEK